MADLTGANIVPTNNPHVVEDTNAPKKGKRFICSANGCDTAAAKLSQIEYHWILKHGPRQLYCPMIQCSAAPFAFQFSLTEHLKADHRLSDEQVERLRPPEPQYVAPGAGLQRPQAQADAAARPQGRKVGDAAGKSRASGGEMRRRSRSPARRDERDVPVISQFLAYNVAIAQTSDIHQNLTFLYEQQAASPRQAFQGQTHGDQQFPQFRERGTETMTDQRPFTAGPRYRQLWIVHASAAAAQTVPDGQRYGMVPGAEAAAVQQNVFTSPTNPDFRRPYTSAYPGGMPSLSTARESRSGQQQQVHLGLQPTASPYVPPHGFTRQHPMAHLPTPRSVQPDPESFPRGSNTAGKQTEPSQKPSVISGASTVDDAAAVDGAYIYNDIGKKKRRYYIQPPPEIPPAPPTTSTSQFTQDRYVIIGNPQAELGRQRALESTRMALQRQYYPSRVVMEQDTNDFQPMTRDGTVQAGQEGEAQVPHGWNTAAGNNPTNLEEQMRLQDSRMALQRQYFPSGEVTERDVSAVQPLMGDGDGQERQESETQERASADQAEKGYVDLTGDDYEEH